MRILIFSYFFLHLLLFVSPVYTEDFTIASQKSYKTIKNKPESTSDLLIPIDPSNDGIEYFLTSIYSHPAYATDILPNTFQHLHQLLLCAPSTQQKTAYQQSVIRLFGNRIKSCTFVNPSALDKILESLPTILDATPANQAKEKEEKKVVDILYEEFLSNFTSFKANPDAFFESLSKKITKTILHAQNQAAQDTTAMQIQLATFLEISIGKLIWSPLDQEKTWTSVKAIAQHLHKLAETKLIKDKAQLCDLFVTLVERYRLFVELMHESLSVSFFEKTRKDILEKSYPLLDYAEQEHFIESRKDRLLRSLEICEARARAREYQVLNSRPLFSEEQLETQNSEPTRKTRKRKRHL